MDGWRMDGRMDGVRRCITDLALTEEGTTYRRMWKKLFWGEGKRMHGGPILELNEMRCRDDDDDDRDHDDHDHDHHNNDDGDDSSV